MQRTRCNEATEILTSYFIHVTSKKIEDSGYMKTIKSTEFLYEVSEEKAELGYKIHDIEIVIDRLKVSTETENSKRLSETINTAMYHGDDALLVIDQLDH